MSADLQGLEIKLGHSFLHRDLLVRSLTHRSFTSEQKIAQSPDNEQFEFFGDSILGFLVSERLIQLFPTAPEGTLSKLKNRLVSADRLHEVAQRLELGDFLRLGRGEEMGGGRYKRSLLSDAVEAIIAALYLDAGVDAARHFVWEQIIGSSVDEENVNYKGDLEEQVHVLRLPRPRYETVEETGPSHAKLFVVEVSVGDYSGKGQASTKKAASQIAAKIVLDQLKS